ncbi:hypothetical protein C8R44DRAFT_749596 [Mycena epipterygia]|nr:hypothetical protein C8R44DRAFT_749596 [Mycena epipterygia]
MQTQGWFFGAMSESARRRQDERGTGYEAAWESPPPRVWGGRFQACTLVWKGSAEASALPATGTGVRCVAKRQHRVAQEHSLGSNPTPVGPGETRTIGMIQNERPGRWRGVVHSGKLLQIVLLDRGCPTSQQYLAAQEPYRGGHWLNGSRSVDVAPEGVGARLRSASSKSGTAQAGTYGSAGSVSNYSRACWRRDAFALDGGESCREQDPLTKDGFRLLWSLRVPVAALHYVDANTNGVLVQDRRNRINARETQEVSKLEPPPYVPPGDSNVALTAIRTSFALTLPGVGEWHGKEEPSKEGGRTFEKHSRPHIRRSSDAIQTRKAVDGPDSPFCWALLGTPELQVWRRR